MRYKIFLVPFLMTLTACASAPLKGDETAISSTPSGADVYADGIKIGKTPMSIKPNDVFPPKWQNWEYQASGVLVIRKQGCEEYAVRVNDGLLRKGIQARLKCNMKTNQQQSVTIKGPVAGAKSDKTSSAAQDTRNESSSSRIEGRLKEAERLYKKGLITHEEYQKARSRILGEL